MAGHLEFQIFKVWGPNSASEQCAHGWRAVHSDGPRAEWLTNPSDQTYPAKLFQSQSIPTHQKMVVLLVFVKCFFRHENIHYFTTPRGFHQTYRRSVSLWVFFSSSPSFAEPSHLACRMLRPMHWLTAFMHLTARSTCLKK